MGKKERHQQDLHSLIDEFLDGGSTSALMAYLLSNSSLPGRRANLELADAFGDVMEERADGQTVRLWRLCMAMTRISPAEAPVNAPEEFLPFCGVIGIGALGSIWAELREKALEELRILAKDPQWRMREAVSFGLQRLLARRPRDTVTRLEEWASDGSPLEMRAAAAGVADPAVLEDGEVALRALHMHETVLERVTGADDRRDEAFRVLRRGLGYTLSVVVHAVPEEGFALMEGLASSEDPDIIWIVKQNLKKKRLVGNHPGAVESVRQYLG